MPPVPAHIRRQRFVALVVLAIAAVAVMTAMAWTISWLWP
jgi:hypothetical protein